jgi:hypothetical protein
MKVELKNIKVCEWMSEETLCFDASIYIDGKRVGTVHNDGHGGCNDYDIPQDVFNKLNEFCKKELNEDFEPIDSYLYDLIEKWEIDKQHKAWCRKAVVFKLKSAKDGEFRTIPTKDKKKPSAQFINLVAKHLKEKYGDDFDYILNEKLA